MASLANLQEINGRVSPQAILSFQRNRGLKFIESQSCWWSGGYRQSRILRSFPEHRVIDPRPEEIREIFRAVPDALALRYPAPVDGCGKRSFMWVRRKPYDLTVLSRNSRSKVRRGLNRCEVRPMSWDELVNQGWSIHVDTRKRQGQPAGDSLGFDLKFRQCPAYTPWGAFIQGTLAAFLVTVSVEDWVHILISRSSSAHLSCYPNNALTFAVIEHYLSRPDISAVSHGWESLACRESLGQFKESMGFTKEPVRQRVILRPWLRLLLNRPVASAMAAVLSIARFEGYRIQQFAGLCALLKES